MSRVGAVAGRTFESLTESRNFRLFFFGQLVSVTGTWFNATAVSVLVLRLSGSGVALGANTALLFLPVLVFGAVGGVLADRHDKRRILVWTQSLYAAVALLEWGLILSGSIRLWMVYGLSLAAGFVTAVDHPTRQSFYVDLVGTEHVTNAISLNSAMFTGTRVVGAALAGQLIHSFGVASAFLIDGVTYLAVIGSLLAMRAAEMQRGPRAAREPGALKEGLRYVWTTPALRRPLVVMTVVFTMSFNFIVLIPLLTAQQYGGDPRVLGWLSAFAGMGMLAGALVMANRAPAPTWARLTGFAAAFGAVLAIEGLMPTLPLSYLVMIPLGFLGMSFAITANSTLQLASRPEMRGRVMAIYGVVFLGSTPVGAPIAGWIGERFGAPAGFVIGGLASVAAGLVGLAVGRRRAAARRLAAAGVDA